MLPLFLRTTFALLLAALWTTSVNAQASPSGAADTYEVHASEIDDLKSVYATVRSRDVVEARVRTGGTIVSLNVDKGDQVEAGKVLAVVVDPKIALRIKALDAQIVAAKSRTETAKAELERAEQLAARGVSAQARVDQAKTAFDVASNDLKAAQAERAVVETQVAEGEVLAPSSGRVLRVPVTVGSVTLLGEGIATIAANGYLLRVEVPERHARFMKKGDVIRVGGRELESAASDMTEGTITRVYPEITNGRVIADAEAPGLGSYFVGERVLTWISAGKRVAFVVPQRFVFRRYSLDYVRLADASGTPRDIVVQLGRSTTNPEGQAVVEILAGVADGDKLVQP
ncbi:MAG TPA: efflux RND transporter periplasmic adaptor subunit [Hyphomicrobium sp.]|nr:efflux RND transporter periplasmic adaptor subunit [Hyphomicrobium sp.]